MSVQMSSGTGSRASTGYVRPSYLRDTTTTPATRRVQSTSQPAGWLSTFQPSAFRPPTVSSTPFTAFKSNAQKWTPGALPSMQASTAQTQYAGPAAQAQFVQPTGQYANATAGAGQATASNARAGQAAQGDWGLNDAALAQVQLIKDWGLENMAAAGESEIARGMGRSGSYDAVQAREMDRARMEATNQMAQAAAEQGRLNQQVAIQNAQNVTQANIASAQMANDVSITNAQLATQASLGNMQAKQALALRMMELQNEIAMQNASSQNEMSRFNAELGTNTNLANAGFQNDAARYNLEAALQREGNQLDYSKFLQQFGLDAWQANNAMRLNFLNYDWGRRNDLANQALTGRGQDMDYWSTVRGQNIDQRGQDLNYNATLRGQDLDYRGIMAQLAAQRQQAGAELAANQSLASQKAANYMNDPAYINAMTNRARLALDQSRYMAGAFNDAQMNGAIGSRDSQGGYRYGTTTYGNWLDRFWPQYAR